MPDRPRIRFSKPCRLTRLWAAVLFALVLLGAQRSAWAARIPAPMCTPDAQSMAAPLQRTPTSAAEIRRENGCPSVFGPSWEILPSRPTLPIDWHMSTADPLWISQAAVRAPRAPSVSLMGPVDSHDSERAGFSNQIFRPPIGDLLLEK
jgi:hypothetical protein